MPTDIIMPKLGLTMDEGTIVRWHATAGERVAQGQVLLEVETDKVTVDVEAPATGVMGTLRVSAGVKVPVGALLARLFAGGEPMEGTTEVVTTAPLKESVVAAEAAPPARITPLARRMAQDAGIDLSGMATGAPDGRITAEEVRAALGTAPRPAVPGAEVSSQNRDAGRARIFSSPRARKQARALGVDWSTLPGTGPRGRVIERDVLAGIKRKAPDAPVRSPLLTPSGSESMLGPSVRWETPTAAQRIAAERMTASFGSAPHFYLSTEVQADALLALRDRLLPAVERKTGVRLTITDLLIRITGAALAEHPRANASWNDGRIGVHQGVNVGIAVATDASAGLSTGASTEHSAGASTPLSTGAGLVVPVLRGADRKPLAQLAAERAGLVTRARAGKLSPYDLADGTFTLTNLGMYRVDSFQAILNPPQSAILAVGRIAERPVAIAGQLAVRRTVVLTLSCDHRVLDGVLGAQFLGRVAELIENPYELLV